MILEIPGKHTKCALGTSNVQLNNVTLNTHFKTLHMVHKHTGNNMHLTLTAVIVPTSKNYTVLSQHFVQLYKQMPVNANDILLNYGKRMQAHDIKTDAKASHKINRDVLRKRSCFIL